MRAIILFVIGFLLCHFTAHGSVFIFKSGKSVNGAVRYEDHSTIRILESSGLEMTLRKSELNLSATNAANVTRENSEPANISDTGKMNVAPAATEKRFVKVYTNRDVRKERVSFAPPDPESSQAWKRSLTKLEREFVRLQGACRGAGTGPNLSKILRSHTYNVRGKRVHVTGYWADPANIEEAKQICEHAIHTESALHQARRGFQNFLDRQKNQNNSLTAQ